VSDGWSIQQSTVNPRFAGETTGDYSSICGAGDLLLEASQAGPLDRNGQYLKDACDAAVEKMAMFENQEEAFEGNYE
jgi:hypothetical protein